MDQFGVSRQLQFVPVPSVADLALETLSLVVYLHVRFQIGSLSESFATLVAPVLLLFYRHMDTLVFIQMGSALTTDWAHFDRNVVFTVQMSFHFRRRVLCNQALLAG